MFKRIGSIVLAVMMVFTMAFSAFALPSDKLALEVRYEEGVTTAKAGDTVKVYVDLVGQMTNLSGLTVFGTYDTEVFSLAEEDIVAAEIDGLFNEPSLNPAEEQDQIKSVWLGVDNVMPEETTLLELDFVVLEDAALGEQTFSFRFDSEGGMVAINGEGTPDYLPADKYEAEPVISESIEIVEENLPVVPSEKATLYAALDYAQVEVGDEVTIRVQIDHYADNMAGLVIDGFYDAEKYELLSIDPEEFGENDAIIVRNEQDGAFNVGWLNTSDVVSERDGFVLFSVTFKAKVAGEALFNFSFRDGGVVSVGANNEYVSLDADTYYVKDANEIVTQIEETLAPADPPKVDIILLSEENIEIGDEVSAKIVLKNYQNNFAGMTLTVSYVEDALELIELKDLGFGPNDAVIVDKSQNGEMNITWLSAENIVAQGDVIELATIRFKAIEANEPAINVYFEEDGVVSIGPDNEYKTLVENEDYSGEGGSISVSITDGSIIVPPELGLRDGNNPNVTLGVPINLLLELNDYANDWAAITIEGTFDPSKVQFKEFIEEDAVDPTVIFDNTNGTFVLVYMDAEAVVLEDNVLGTLCFDTIEAGESKINVSFKDEGVLAIGPNGEYIVKEAETDYVKNSNEITTMIIEEIVPTKPELNVQVEGDLEEITKGQSFSVTVDLKDYANNWAAFTVEGAYDADLFDLTAFGPATVGDATVVPVVDEDNGKIIVTFINATNIEAAADSNLFTLYFEAKAEGEGAFNFGFKEDGVISIGENGEYNVLVADTDYVASAEEVSLTVVAQQPVGKLSLEAAIQGGATTVEKGETITVLVDVHDYKDDLASLTIEGTFNKDLFELTSATPATFGANDATVSIDNVNGKVSAAWINSTNVDADAEFTALTLVFTAKAAGEAAFNFNFKDGGNVSIGPDGGYITYQPETDYEKAAEEIGITVTDTLPPVEKLPSIVVDKEAIDGEAGEEFTFNINLKDYNNRWASFTAEATFDPALFEVVSVVPAALGDATAVPVVSDGAVSITFINATNIEADADALLATVTLKAKAGGEDTIEVAIKDGSVISIGAEGEYITLVGGEDYIDAVAEIEATIEEAPVAPALKPTVSVKDNKTTVKQGETVTLIVGVENYNELLTGMTIEGSFDSDVFEVTDITPEALEGVEVVPVIDANKYTVAFMDADGCDVNASAFKLFEVTLTAKADATLGDTDLAIFFVADGMADANGDALAADKYVADRQIVSITIEEAEEQECQHDWSAAPEHDNNTAGATSKHVYTCTLGCGATKSEACSFTEVNRVPADCDTAEQITYKCSACDYEYTVDGEPATDHDWSGKPAHKDGTEGANGMHVYTCGNGCGETKEEACSFTEVNRVPADCDTAEQITYKCSACGYEYTVDGEPATDHDWSGKPVHKDGTEGANGMHVYTCGNGCGETKEEACSFAEVNRVPADCDTAEKITYKCSACGYEYTVDGEPATDHDWSGKPAHKDGTEGANGMHVYTCGNGCGETKEEACSFTEVNRVPADCDTAEKITYKCSACGYEYTVDGEPATDHDWSGKPVHKDGTEGANGMHVYTCGYGCGETKEEACSFTTQVFDASCAEEGYTLYTCTECGYSYKDNFVAGTKHDNLVVRYYAPSMDPNGHIGWIDHFCYDCYHAVREGEQGRYEVLKAGAYFKDVASESWFSDAVGFCKAFGIFGGDAAGNFNPGRNFTRGQMVTVLGRIMAPEVESMSKAEFEAFLAEQTSLTGLSGTGLKDVNGTYYERYAKLLNKWGIVLGSTDGNFYGNNTITRQEMATMFKRFVVANDVENLTFGNAATFNDLAKADGWATENVEWVGQVGLFQGDNKGNYNPKANATTAEVAVVLYRMIPAIRGIEVVK